MNTQRPPYPAPAPAAAAGPAVNPAASARVGRRGAVPGVLLLAAALLGGCADSPFMQQHPARTASHPKATAVLERDAPPVREAPSRARDHDPDPAPRESTGLRDGIRLYNEGDFDGAIKRLSARDLNNGPLSTRLAAIKYTAFSYCVTGRPVQCRQSFDKALRLDPNFELAPGEEGHPLWGPVFAKAKQAAAPHQ